MNPASIANSPYKYDVNLLNGNFYFTNNIGYLGKSSDGDRGFIRNVDGQQRFLNSDLRLGAMGVMLSLKNKASIGIQYQFRTVASGIDISPEFIEQFGRLGSIEFAGSSVVGQSGDAAAMGWHDLSFTYAGLVVDNGYYRVKVGGTFKLVNPIGNAVARLESLSYASDDTGLVEVTNLQGQVAYSENLNDFEQFDGTEPIKFPPGTGYRLAVDVGVVYETSLFRDDPQRDAGNSYYADIRYEQRLGVSITDIGKMSFNYGSASFDVLNVLPQTTPIDFDNLLSGISSVRELQDSIATVSDVADLTGSYTVSMPTALNVNYDYNFRNNWFLNVAGQFDFSKLMNADYRINYPNSITITPRYETGFSGAYFPVYVNLEGDMELGAALRYGPITLGTHSLGSLFSAKPESGGVFFSLNINKLKLNSDKPYCFGSSKTGTAGTRRKRTPLHKRKKFLFF